MRTLRIIIDLDGTLIEGNSFTMFVKHLFRHASRVRVRVAYIVALRKLRLVSHFEAKRRIMLLAADYMQAHDIDRFTEKLAAHVRPRFLALLQARGDECCLATAAPQEYAAPLASRLGFGRVAATDSLSGRECRGEEKVRRLKALGVEFGEETEVYTDHRDDLPLLAANRDGVNWLVDPDPRTLAVAGCSGIPFRTILV